MTIYEVIKRPLVTEKGVTKKESERTLCFEVAPDANKVQVRKAVEGIYKVKVADVTTVKNAGKTKRLGQRVGRRSDWKKAYVTLKPGEKIDIFEGA